MERGREKKNYIDLFLPPFQAFPFPPRSLSSTFVDKSHICVPFWRLLIVLNRRNYSQGVVAAAVQRCWWPGCCVSLCKVLPCVSSTSNILLWPPTARPFWATPLGASAAPSPHLSGTRPYFYLLHLKARGDKSRSWSPPLPVSIHTHTLTDTHAGKIASPIGLLRGALIRSGYLQRRTRRRALRFIAKPKPLMWGRGLSAKHTSMPPLAWTEMMK